MPYLLFPSNYVEISSPIVTYRLSSNILSIYIKQLPKLNGVAPSRICFFYVEHENYKWITLKGEFNTNFFSCGIEEKKAVKKKGFSSFGWIAIVIMLIMTGGLGYWAIMPNDTCPFGCVSYPKDSCPGKCYCKTYISGIGTCEPT